METLKEITMAITAGVLGLFIFTLITIAVKIIKEKKIDIRGIRDVIGRQLTQGCGEIGRRYLIGEMLSSRDSFKEVSPRGAICTVGDCTGSNPVAPTNNINFIKNENTQNY